MKRKMRFISLLTIFTLLVGFLPTVTFAAESVPTITSVGGITVDQETNMGGAPTVIKGSPYSAQVVATGGNLTYTAGSGGYMDLPDGLSINSSTGLISGTCTADSGRYNAYIEVSNTAGTAHAVVGFTVGDATLKPTITTAEGSLGTTNKDSSSEFTVSIDSQNGEASSLYNFAWSLESGALPAGMSLKYAKMPIVHISGIPTETGTFEFVLEAENDFGSVTRAFSIEVVEGSVGPNIIQSSLEDGVVGQAYEYQLEVTGTNTQENPILWSTNENDFTQESYNLGNGLSMSKTGLITGIPENASQVSFMVYAKNNIGIDYESFHIIIHDNGEVTSVSVMPEEVIAKKGSTQQFKVSLEGYGDVEEKAYWNFYIYDEGLGSAFPQPTDSTLSVDGSTSSGSVTLAVGANEERQQFRVVAYSKPGNNGVKGYATVNVVDAQVTQKTELSSITGSSSLDKFLVEGGTLPDTSAPAMPFILNVGKNYNMETVWQKYNGANWANCMVGDTIEENGQYRIATTIMVDDEDFEQYTPASLISLTIDEKAWTTEAPITGVDEFHFRAYSPTFTLENANSIFTTQPQNGDVNINSTYTVNWGLKYEPDSAPIVQFNDNGNWTTLENAANKTSTEVTVTSSAVPVVRQCRVMATYQNASKDPFYAYSNEFTITWHGKYAITVTNGKAYDAYDSLTDSAFFGETIMLKADTIAEKTFKSWSITGGTADDENAKNTYMTMPKNAVTAEATYIDNSTYAFVNQPQNATVEYDEDYEVTWSMNFVPTSVRIERYKDDTQEWLELSGATATGGTISSYDFDVTNKYRVVAYIDGTPVYSEEFTVTWEKTYTINCYAYDITNSDIAGGTVTLTTNKGSGDNNLNPSKRATKNTDVTINAVASSGYEFVEWRKGGPTMPALSTNPNHTFAATEAVWLYAIFQEIPMQPTTYTVAVSANTIAGGNVAGAGTYNANAQVTLTATPNSGYNFVKWTENGSPVSTDATYVFEAEADRTLVAVFETITYSMEITQTGTYFFPDQQTGYAAVTPLTVTLTNSGTGETDDLTVTLNGNNASDFTLSKTTISSIAVGGDSTFTVTPNIGLTQGIYTAQVIVQGQHNLLKSFNVQLNVTDEPTHIITLSQTEDYTFTSANAGYGTQTPLTVTINSIGTGESGTLTVSLTGANPSDFELSTTEISSIISGGSDTFMVSPKTGLSVGMHTATVVVSNGNDINKVFGVSFKVIGELAGTVVVDGTPKFGSTLTANTSGITNNTGTLSYQWKRGSSNIGTNSNSYTLVEDDIGSTITVTVTSSIETGAVVSAETDIIEKADGSDAPILTPHAPSVIGMSDGKISGTNNEMEWADNIDFQNTTPCANSEITGLPAGTYYVRFAETNTKKASAIATIVISEGAAYTYSISIDKPSTYTFDSAIEGYSSLTAADVTVTNTGTGATGELTIVLSGTDATRFTLSKNILSDISAGNNSSFTVVPVTGLTTGTYTATITVSGANSISASFDVNFTVNQVPTTYTVTFNSNGGSEVADITNITSGTKVQKPSNPTKSGYTFVGWYKEAELTNEFNFINDTITANTTLFAKWKVKQTSSGGGGSSSVTKYEITVTAGKGGSISPETTKVEKGDDKRFTIKANEGYEIEDVLVDGKSVGVVESYKFEKVKEKHTIEATFKKVEEKEEVKDTEEETTWENSFEDISEDAWYYEAVEFANENNLFSGMSAKEFGPSVAMTRGMFVTVLSKLNGGEIDGEADFVDVDPNAYYAKPVAWTYTKGIVNGVGNNKFAPNMSITREQLAVMMYNYMVVEQIDKPASLVEFPEFADAEEISSWAESAVNVMRATGLMSGKPNNKFDPKGTATRAEVATILMNFCK